MGWKFAEHVEAELARARDAHPPIQCLHEGHSVILEEVEEFWAEVKKKDAQRNGHRLISELVQIAAMAQRVAEDVLGVC